jgi:hypothetical protein
MTAQEKQEREAQGNPTNYVPCSIDRMRVGRELRRAAADSFERDYAERRPKVRFV